MAKIKMFFKKIGAYIKNTAWIQPILIVIVIFVVLFSLNPITEAIKKGWTSITTVNKMETITYKEYVEKVQTGEDFVVVFTEKGNETCADLYKRMNEFLKSDTYKDGDFKVYNVNLSTKFSKTKINDRKYEQYKDSTCGIVSASNVVNSEVVALDHVSKLDARIGEFLKSFGETAYNGVTSYEGQDKYYDYVVAPLFVWYQDGLETRVCNNWTADSYSNDRLFREFITEFEVEGLDSNWEDSFDLTYAE